MAVNIRNLLSPCFAFAKTAQLTSGVCGMTRLFLFFLQQQEKNKTYVASYTITLALPAEPISSPPADHSYFNSYFQVMHFLKRPSPPQTHLLRYLFAHTIFSTLSFRGDHALLYQHQKHKLIKFGWHKLHSSLSSLMCCMFKLWSVTHKQITACGEADVPSHHSKSTRANVALWQGSCQV